MERSVPPDLDMHVILDNDATHEHPTAKRWLTIAQYIDRRNDKPTSFVWTATVQQILKKVGRANAMLETLH
jgi:hypothetical protein